MTPTHDIFPNVSPADDAATLIVRYLDNQLDERSVEQLSDLIVNEDEVRDLFVAMCMQARVISSRLGPELEAHAAPRMADHDESMTILREVIELEEQAGRRRLEAMAQEQAASREQRQAFSHLSDQWNTTAPVRHYVIPRWAAYGTVGAAAAILLLLLLPYLRSEPVEMPAPPAPPPTVAQMPAPPPMPSPARVRDAYDLAWASDSSQAHASGALAAGTYEIVAGGLELELADGGSVIVQAPARFRVDSGRRITLLAGRLVGRCPGQGSQLIVETPGASVLDIGTEFGVLVDDRGASQVHVFEGLVEIRSHASAGGMPPTRITRGQARLIDRSGERIEPIAHEELAFVRRAEFTARLATNRDSAYHRWVRHQYAIRRDPSLVVYYVMHPMYMDGQMMMNLGRAGAAANGVATLTQWTKGRFGDTTALAFTHPEALIRADIPGRSEQLTIAAWVKLNRISSPHSGIVMSERWLGDQPGLVHFGIESTGRIGSSITGLDGEALQTTSKQPQVTSEHLGRWIHLAAVYDNEQGFYRVYRNGERVVDERIPAHFPANIGQAQIGNWTAGALGWPGSNRVLNGSMDELCIFHRALSEQEVQQMYQAGLVQEP